MWNDLEHRETPSEKFYGNYLAEVVDVDDSPNTTGRIKVRVFPMMQELAVAVLPWAVPAFPLFEGAGSDVGSYVVPDEGSRVWVFFSVGDVRSPVYFANAPCATDGPSTRSPTKKMWKTRAGHTIEIEDNSGSESIKVTHSGGTTIEMDSSNKLVVTAVGDVEITGGAKVTIDPKCEVATGSLPLGKCLTDKTLPNCFYSGAPMPGTLNLQVG